MKEAQLVLLFAHGRINGGPSTSDLFEALTLVFEEFDAALFAHSSLAELGKTACEGRLGFRRFLRRRRGGENGRESAFGLLRPDGGDHRRLRPECRETVEQLAQASADDVDLVAAVSFFKRTSFEAIETLAGFARALRPLLRLGENILRIGELLLHGMNEASEAGELLFLPGLGFDGTSLRFREGGDARTKIVLLLFLLGDAVLQVCVRGAEIFEGGIQPGGTRFAIAESALQRLQLTRAAGDFRIQMMQMRFRTGGGGE